MIQLGTQCSGPCVSCQTNYVGGCVAGHGDDEYVFADPNWIQKWRLRVEIEAIELQMDRTMSIRESDALKVECDTLNEQLKALQ